MQRIITRNQSPPRNFQSLLNLNL
ncbi:hypothetical protein MED222_05510 [Vibrio sp. MED222]|nr:hypothetical protein MED222_05510 [Vibrio sp. MED222]